MPVLDNQQRRIFRLASAVTLASSAAVAIGWPLAFVVPLLVVSIVSGSDRAPPLKVGVGMVLIIAAGVLVGLLFSKLFLGQPVLASFMLTLIFSWIYYLSNLGRLHPFASIMLLIGMTVIPLVALIDARLASGVAQGLVVAATAALGFAYIGYWLFPHREELTQECIQPKVLKDASQCVRRAAISTLAVVPAMIVFIAFELSGSALIIAFIAILSLNPALEQAREAGLGLILGNLLSGAVALVFYHWLMISPHLGVYAATIALFSLLSRQACKIR
jgi:uncharacterized membrane protein YccC